MNRTVLIVGAVLVVPLLAFLAAGFRFDPHTIESPLIGKPAPTFDLVDLEGQRFDLAALAGQPVVINFWSTWCPPCITEHPLLIEAARRYAGRVHFLGVIYQDEPDLIRGFLGARGEWGPSLIDPGSEVAIAYGVYGPPETFVLDAGGVVVYKIIGQLDWNALVSTLEGLT